MIVVVGSRHDPVAADLVDRWHQASLCGAEDLTTSGWAWSPTGAVESTWVVDGHTVPDARVTGVFLCRQAVYPEEFTATQPEDRAYLAAESHAFLADVVASTGARVPQPVGDGSFGDELLRPDRWMAAADQVGLAVSSLRLRSAEPLVERPPFRQVEVVDSSVFGDIEGRTRTSLVDLAAALGVGWLTVAIDGEDRLCDVTSRATPSPAARDALEALLGGHTT